MELGQSRIVTVTSLFQQCLLRIAEYLNTAFNLIMHHSVTGSFHMISFESNFN